MYKETITQKLIFLDICIVVSKPRGVEQVYKGVLHPLSYDLGWAFNGGDFYAKR